MELDRQSIEKRDFPIGRRGYEPEAVDAHLEAVAREVEALKQTARSRSGESLASAASSQVQAIVEAAETTAADIERQAGQDASRIRQDAEREAERTSEEAVSRSREHVNKVSEASATMVLRVDAMESELGALFESLRTGANRLNADLSLLGGNMAELYGAAGSAAPGAPSAPGRYAPELDEEAGLEVRPERARESTEVSPPPHSVPPVAAAPLEAAPEPDASEDVGAPLEAVPEPDVEDLGAPLEAVPEPAAVEEAVPPLEATPAPAGAQDPGDVEGARLIALNMALNGQPREETDRYLAENFELEDRAGLLDEVYAAVGG